MDTNNHETEQPQIIQVTIPVPEHVWKCIRGIAAFHNDRTGRDSRIHAFARRQAVYELPGRFRYRAGGGRGFGGIGRSREGR